MNVEEIVADLKKIDEGFCYTDGVCKVMYDGPLIHLGCWDEAYHLSSSSYERMASLCQKKLFFFMFFATMHS